MGRACGAYGGKNKCIQCLGGEMVWKELPDRPERRWEYNMNRTEIW